jgi:PadR family transcriptional regulator PadR
MKNEELLTYRWQESTSGPPRKYYALTEQGQELLAQLHDEWKSIQKAVAAINIE